MSDGGGDSSKKPKKPRKSRPSTRKGPAHGGRDPYVRAENEDDDGYDPYSDRPARPEPLFERDPWD